jgi:hypothetical protein
MIVNLAGHQVSIFLFRFVLRKNAISFVLNESIAEDMYPGIDEEIQPLAQACSKTLLRYKDLCKSEIIMDGNILVDGDFEVMLSKGLGQHFAESEKQNLFKGARKISNLLLDVMDRRSHEMDQGSYPGPQPYVNKIQRSATTTKGLETLGKEKRNLEHEGDYLKEIRPGLKRLRPEDLPDGVTAKHGYDHRGRCLAFEHTSLGEIGQIILINIDHEQIRIEAELSKTNPEYLNKKEVLLKEIMSIIEMGLTEPSR